MSRLYEPGDEVRGNPRRIWDKDLSFMVTDHGREGSKVERDEFNKVVRVGHRNPGLLELERWLPYV